MATPTATRSTVSSIAETNTMVATIAPGPASSGVPSGTSATFTFSLATGSSIWPVRSSSATSRSSRPPAPWSAGSVMPR